MTGYMFSEFWIMFRYYVTGWYIFEDVAFAVHYPEYSTTYSDTSVQRRLHYQLTLASLFKFDDVTPWRWMWTGQYFLYLRDFFLLTANGENEQWLAIVSDLADIVAFLNSLDEQFIYQYLHSNLFRRRKLYKPSRQNEFFLYLFTYHLCYLLLGVGISPSGINCNTVSLVDAASRMFESFRTIEFIVDEFQSQLTNENSIGRKDTDEETFGDKSDEGKPTRKVD